MWGWADIHCHPMAQAGFGELMHGHMHGPVEDLGSCMDQHGYMHQNLLKPASIILDGGRYNDGSLATSGWTTLPAGPGTDDELGFRGWPAFDDKTHLKTHQDWIRRAYDGGQRLMVALIVHNQMLAVLSTASQLMFSAQSDRDTVEPQVRMLREFVAHNGDWCGIATTPDEARDLIEANKMAFVLGLETDSINDWVHDATSRPPTRPTADPRPSTTTSPTCKKLGVVQVNLIHLTDNAFGGMALYNRLFMINSFTRRGVLPDDRERLDRPRHGRGEDQRAGRHRDRALGEPRARADQARDHVAVDPPVRDVRPGRPQQGRADGGRGGRAQRGDAARDGGGHGPHVRAGDRRGVPASRPRPPRRRATR